MITNGGSQSVLIHSQLNIGKRVDGENLIIVTVVFTLKN